MELFDSSCGYSSAFGSKNFVFAFKCRPNVDPKVDANFSQVHAFLAEEHGSIEEAPMNLTIG